MTDWDSRTVERIDAALLAECAAGTADMGDET